MQNQVRDIRRARFYWIDNEVLDFYIPRIGWKGLIVYNALCRYANNDSGKADPSIPTLAQKLQVSEYTIKEGLKALKECNLIDIIARNLPGDKTRRASNLYLILEVGDGSPHDPPLDRHTIQGGSPHDPGVDRHTTGNYTKNKTHLTKGESEEKRSALSIPDDLLRKFQEITGLDGSMNGTGANIDRLWQQLGQPGTDALDRFRMWWAGNWRSREGDLPTLAQVKSNWPTAQKKAKASGFKADKDDDLNL